MIPLPPELPVAYTAALRVYLAQGGATERRAAAQLGEAALAAGCVPAVLARLHARSCRELAPTADFADPRTRRRGGLFLAAALRPMGRVQRRQARVLQGLRRQADGGREQRARLAASNRELKRELAQGKAAAAAVKRGEARYQVLFVRSQFMQRELRHLARQILTAQEDERRKISRELHDEVVQTLVGISVDLAALGRSAALGQRALRAKIAHTQRLVAKSVDAVHRFARELRPAVLDDLGLIPALHTLVKVLAGRHRLRIRLTAFAGVEALESARRTVLFRVAQEAMTNIGKHARARTVAVTLAQVGRAVRLTVQDDGRSFAISPALSIFANRGLGLMGMRERLEMVGGTLRIASVPGQGTTVSAEVPFRKRSAP